MKIMGVTHPIPTEFAERIYNGKKSVFIAKSYLGKVSKGDKFIIYESYGMKAYTGWANIKYICKMTQKNVLNKYKSSLMLTEEEFKDYTKGRSEITVIVFEKFKKFKNPVKPHRFVSISGKYIYEDEFEFIESNKN